MASQNPVQGNGKMIAAWVCLAVAWLAFLVPLPGTGLFIGWPLNLAAFILAIIAISNGRRLGGILALLASLVISPVVYLIGLAIFGAALEATNRTSDSQPAAVEQVAAAASQATAAPEAALPGIGDTVRTNYFDVTLNNCTVRGYVGTGDELFEPEAREGSEFLIIDASFRNIDTESRMPQEGSVFLTVDGSEYEFDASETIMLEGWGLMLDSVSPLTQMTTKIVYRVPLGAQGVYRWKPGRNDSEQGFVCE